LHDVRNPPSLATMAELSSCEVVAPDAPDYGDLTFAVEEWHDEAEGRFCWGIERDKAGLWERFYDAIEAIDYGEERQGKAELRKLVKEDPLFIDAYVHLGALEAEDGNDARAMRLFEKAYQIGSSRIPDDFDGHVLWGVTANRSFMRAVQGLGVCYLDQANLLKALPLFDALLRYNPGDNQGARALAIQCNLALGQYMAALQLCDRYDGDTMVDTIYGRPLALCALGDESQAEDATVAAVTQRPLVGEELLKTNHAPPTSRFPGAITVGGEDEAFDYWQRVGPCWTANDRAMELLQASIGKARSG